MGSEARKSLGSQKSTAAPPPVPSFKYGGMVQVQGIKPIFDVKFHLNLKPGQPNIFAVVGPTRICIFECNPKEKMKILQMYGEADDKFYCCAWSSNDKGEPILATGGESGYIRLLSPAHGNCYYTLRGHPNSINDMTFHPQRKELLLTASKDHSIRLWNVQTYVLVAIFGGVDGHRDEILSISFNIQGNRVVSGGMDHAIKLWHLNKPSIQLAIEKSYKFIVSRHSKAFPTVTQHLPDFTTRNIHGNYVDCVRWFGDLVVSKSVQNQIQIWKAGWPLQKLDNITPAESHSTILATLGIEDCTIWYVRFCMDSMNTILALGNEVGHVYVYHINNLDAGEISYDILQVPKCTGIVRQTAISRDGSILLAVSDDGSVWRWDSVPCKK